MGVSEEGRDQVAIAIGTPEAIKNLEKYKADLAALGDPRKTTPEQAQQLIKTAKPIYWVTSGIHSPETGGPEMLIELAYRLAVEDTPSSRTSVKTPSSSSTRWSRSMVARSRSTPTTTARRPASRARR
jgi:hypothetical protein